MTTACINPSKGRFVHPVKHHGITVRQAARIQTFPDDFVFGGGLMAAGKQVGNAVPVELGRQLITRLLPLLRRGRIVKEREAPTVHIGCSRRTRNHMITSVAFQTKARTVDHLGREQIADTPTAISELWKNAFDAYARNVALDIFDGENPVAVIEDDGHGMNRDEFVNRWLVVGTKSKATSERTPVKDRNGLDPRPRQGQKGIGRLSCANLGPILLLVSKRRDQPFCRRARRLAFVREPVPESVGHPYPGR